MTNVIVMTAGLAGSSVLTGLVARGGLWAGNETFKKSDYNTYENSRLIELNRTLFDAVGFDGEYTDVFPEWVGTAIEQKIDELDAGPFVEFIRECNDNGPWIWKDPRLNFTIGAWARWLDLSSIRFLINTREPVQSWISSTLRRHIQTYSYHCAYNERVRREILDFLDRHNLQHLPIVYEELVLRPEETLQRLNQYLGTQLTLRDLEQIYSKTMYKRQHGAGSALKALMIYLKNYRQRKFLDRESRSGIARSHGSQ